MNRPWPDFKKLLDGTEKRLSIQSETRDDYYSLLAVDGILTYDSQIFFSGHEPPAWSQSEIDANTSNRTDFETNYQPSINRTVALSHGTNVQHLNGNATTSATTLTPASTSRALLIHNTSSTGTLLVSFDGGTNWKTITAGSSIQMDIVTASFKVKSSAGTVPYETLVVS